MAARTRQCIGHRRATFLAASPRPATRGRLLVLPPPVARRSLKPQLNQIRTWVRQGRTDAWIAHQLEVTVKDLQAFKREHELAADDAESDGETARGGLDEELDLREEDDALVAAELDAMTENGSEEEGAAPAESGDEEDEEGEQRSRRRGRRGGRRRRGGGRGRRSALEGTIDHGEEGYGLWLDPGVQDDPVYAEHWAGHRAVTVAIEPDRIVIRRSGDQAAASAGADSPADDADPDEFAA